MDSLVLVGSERPELALIDIQSPAQPSLVNRISLPGPVEAIAVEKNLAYLALGDRGLHVFDLARPDQPQRLTDLPLAGLDIQNVQVDAGLAILSGRAACLSSTWLRSSR